MFTISGTEKLSRTRPALGRIVSTSHQERRKILYLGYLSSSLSQGCRDPSKIYRRHPGDDLLAFGQNASPTFDKRAFRETLVPRMNR